MHFRVQRSKNTEQIRILFILLGGSLICETSFNYLSVSYYYDFFYQRWRRLKLIKLPPLNVKYAVPPRVNTITTGPVVASVAVDSLGEVYNLTTTSLSTAKSQIAS